MAGLKRAQHLRLAFIDIELATKNFETCIGKGGYGRVYKGELSISGKLTTVAVKRLDVQYGQGLKEFLTEIELLTGQQHPNLVSLLGYCDEGDEKIIVYEYAERGSLEQYIRHSIIALTWLERLRICIDAACGLDHLHSHVGKHQSIIHRDIKSANILLDQKWVAKISDFGLAKLSLAGLDRSAVISRACGTLGYCDPEYISSGIVTKKSDVFSFGMVLFEVLCGKLCTVRDKNGSLLSAKLVKECYKNKKLDEIIDPSLREQMSSYSMSKFSTIAYRCLAYRCLDDDRERRPPMDVVKKELMEILEIQGQPQVNKSTWRRHLEPEYDVSNGHLNQSIDNDNHQKFAHMPFSQNADHDYDYDNVNIIIEDVTDDSYNQPPSMSDEFDSCSLEEEGPGIEGFQIIGDAKPGGTLVGCGYSVRGTVRCKFKWVRYLQDGTGVCIAGATSPEYVVTADDVDKLIAVECIPVDEQGRQGGLVRVFANEQKKIMCDGFQSSLGASNSLFETV